LLTLYNPTLAHPDVSSYQLLPFVDQPTVMLSARAITLNVIGVKFSGIKTGKFKKSYQKIHFEASEAVLKPISFKVFPIFIKYFLGLSQTPLNSRSPPQKSPLYIILVNTPSLVTKLPLILAF